MSEENVVASSWPERVASADKPSIKLLLLSGGSLPGQPHGYALEWVKKHFDASPNAPKNILSIPYAQAPKDWDKNAEVEKRAFRLLGINIISAHTVDDPRKLLDKVDDVFVTGGNTFRLLKKLKETGLLSAIQEKVRTGIPYAGTSAGTIVACPTIMNSNDMNIIPDLESLNALGVFPVQINAHHIRGHAYYPDETGNYMCHNGETREDRIEEFHEEHPTMPVIGLPERTAIRMVGNMVEVLGNKPAWLYQAGKEPISITDGKILSALVPALSAPGVERCA